ncbi:MAG: acyl carrier protein [Halanaerobiales bacterium]|nr:acyl carrier protein [Halanaerobiales bacterium]
MNKDIEKFVRGVLEEFLEDNFEDLDVDTDLKELGVDSLMFYEIEEVLESEYDIQIGDRLRNARTLRSIVELITDLKK